MPTIVRMPDGKKVRFGDEFSREEIGALIAEKYPDFAAQHQKPGPADYAVQGLSGVNEGLGNILGAPVDIATMGINAGIAGLNTLFPAERGLSDLVTGEEPKPRFSPIEKPFLGSEQIKEALTAAGTIAPESEDVGLQVTRRIGEEVGAAAPVGLGIAGRVAQPLKMLAGEIGGAIGSGTGAAVAEQVAPDNPWAELAGQLIGGFGPGLGVAAVARKQAIKKAVKDAPSAEELETAKKAAYAHADSLGAKYTGQSYSGLVGNVDAVVAKHNISPTRHPKAHSFVQDMRLRGKNGLTLTELDQLRQEVRRDLIRSSDESEQFFGELVLDEIDSFIAKAGAKDMASGDAAVANEAILTARELNRRWRKTEMIEDALYRAQMNAASSGSGGNIANTLRQAIKSILLSERKSAAFSADEIKAMEGVIKQGKVEELLRLVGKLSPQGNGLMAALSIGGVASNPALIAAPIAGTIAKGMADSGTINKAAALRARVAGGSALTAPIMTPERVQSAAALSVGQGANQAANDNNALRKIRLNALN